MVWLVTAAQASLAESSRIAVIYPDIHEPYLSIFREFISGIDEGFDGPLDLYPLGEGEELPKLRGWLEEKGIQVIIALGHRGSKAALELPATFRVVIGAVTTIPDSGGHSVSGIILTPDPDRLFDQLQRLAPQVSRITVLYNPDRTGWLIERASLAARARGLDLNALRCQDLRNAAGLYREVLSKSLDDGKEAIWISQDPCTVDTRVILPMLLREAWDKKVILFSSNPAHVKRGVLFSFFPDNVGAGRGLGALAERYVQTDSTGSTIMPLQNLLTAVNLRTADHLGLRFTSQQRRGFDLVFPAP
jgi:putative ABC transport system substrate-binding protein